MEPQRSVLVIEDNAVLRDILKSVFEGAKMEVGFCCDGSEAIAALEQKGYDTLVVDYRMPDMGGVEVVKTLRRLLFPATIIGISIENREQEFLSAGADAFLMKPFEIDDLLDLVRKERQTASHLLPVK